MYLMRFPIHKGFCEVSFGLEIYSDLGEIHIIQLFGLLTYLLNFVVFISALVLLAHFHFMDWACRS